MSGIGEDITLTINQFRTRGDIIAVVDRTYDVVIKTTNGKILLNGIPTLVLVYCRCKSQWNIDGGLFE